MKFKNFKWLKWKFYVIYIFSLRKAKGRQRETERERERESALRKGRGWWGEREAMRCSVE